MDMEMDDDGLAKKIRFRSSEAEAFCQCGVSVFLMITHPKTNMAMETHHF